MRIRAKHKDTYVNDNTQATEEGARSDALGPVNDLVRNDEVSRSDLLSERSDGREGDDGLDTDALEGGDVGSGGDLRGRNVWSIEIT